LKKSKERRRPLPAAFDFKKKDFRYAVHQTQAGHGLERFYEAHRQDRYRAERCGRGEPKNDRKGGDLIGLGRSTEKKKKAAIAGRL
jgi:hypothetical protein